MARRPWILASLHSGVIQLWDYRMGSLLDRFDEHDGPVRGVNFHYHQPLFVSGGDDYKIKVWNYKLRRCLFTLLGHLDYIRTVEFHQEHPWLLSASDDQTIRIWNWQNRSCLSVLTGHNHYVMCAGFHFQDDLVVSASLDQTVRVWDIGGLRKKGVSPSGDDLVRMPQINSDLFGGGDAVVKYVLEGHDRGVNWASFHPTLPLIVSGADDRQVKLWRMNDTKAWEVDTLRGHMNNVSCVLFHARQDVIVSNSEDKSIRIWDMSKRTGVQTFRREHDRFWILASHPEINLIAAGHDSGMIVFKLERERPTYCVAGGTLLYVRERYLRQCDLASQQDMPLLLVRRGGSGLGGGLRNMSFNPAEHLVLLQSDQDGGTYELMAVPKDSSRSDSNPDSMRGQGSSATFIARNRFAVLEKGSNTILVKNLQNEVTKRVPSPCSHTEALFYAGTGTVLVRGDEKVVLYDLQQRLALAEMTVAAVKYVVWNDDHSRVALLSKHSVIVADRKFKDVHTIHETMRVKSAVWDKGGVLIYGTLNHLEYCLPNGDCGTIQTLDTPIYLTKIEGSRVHCLDREGKTRVMEIDSSEYRFKLALVQHKFDTVVALIKANRMCGQSIIAYIQQRGFPEVALHFVDDPKVCFTLAVQCGNIEIALRSAAEIDSPDTWYRLGVEALRHGNYEIVEYCYQKTSSFEKLAFLYLITGNLEKLNKMMKISENKQLVMDQFHTALYLGDVRERISILHKAGQLHLAAGMIKAHGLEADEAFAAVLAKVESADADGLAGPDPKLLMPPTPILKDTNWPLLNISKGALDSAFDFGQMDAATEQALEAGAEIGEGWGGEDLDDVAGGAWGMDEDGGLGEAGGAEDALAGLGGADDDEDGGWDMEDLELPPELAASATKDMEASEFTAPNPGVSPDQKWTAEAQIPAEFVGAGDYDSACRLLGRQSGVEYFDDLKKDFVDLSTATYGFLSTAHGLPTQAVPLDAKYDGQAEPFVRTAPANSFSLEQLEGLLKASYQLTTGGKFGDAVTKFRQILQTTLVLSVDSRKESEEAEELVGLAAEYIAALQVVQQQKATKGDAKRAAELAAYFTHFKLQSVHMLLALRQAMLTFAKLKNFKTASVFAKRLLEQNAGAKVTQQARQVLAACEQSPSDAVDLEYDSRNPFVLCALSMVPIYKGSPSISCPYCAAKYLPEHAGKQCAVCKAGKIGGQGAGLLISRKYNTGRRR